MYTHQYIINLFGKHKPYFNELKDKIATRGMSTPLLLNYNYATKKLDYSGEKLPFTSRSRIYIIAHGQFCNDKQIFPDDFLHSIDYVELARLIKENFTCLYLHNLNCYYPKIILLSCVTGISLNSGYPFEGFAGNFHRELAEDQHGGRLYSMVVAPTTITSMNAHLEQGGRKTYGIPGCVSASLQGKTVWKCYGDDLGAHKVNFSWNPNNGKQIVFSKGIEAALGKKYVERDDLDDIFAQYKDILLSWKRQVRPEHVRGVDAYINLLTQPKEEGLLATLCHSLNSFRDPNTSRPAGAYKDFGKRHDLLRDNYRGVYYALSVLTDQMMARRALINYYGRHAEISCPM